MTCFDEVALTFCVLCACIIVLASCVTVCGTFKRLIVPFGKCVLELIPSGNGFRSSFTPGICFEACSFGECALELLP